eukprot:gene19278-biopygen3296
MDEARLMGVRQLPATWANIVSASDGGLHRGHATVGAVLLRRDEDGTYAGDGPAVCEITGRLLGPSQEVYLAESEAVERVCHATPPNARDEIWMDALSRGSPPPVAVTTVRAGNDPVTIRLENGVLVDGPIWEALSEWVDALNLKALAVKRSIRREGGEGAATAEPVEPGGGDAAIGATPAEHAPPDPPARGAGAERGESPVELSDAEGAAAGDAAAASAGAEDPATAEGPRAFVMGDTVRLDPAAVTGDKVCDPSGWYLYIGEEAVVSGTAGGNYHLIDPRGSVSAHPLQPDRLVLVRAAAAEPARAKRAAAPAARPAAGDGAGRDDRRRDARRDDDHRRERGDDRRGAPPRRRGGERDARSRGRGPGSHKQEPECYRDDAVDFRKVRQSISLFGGAALRYGMFAIPGAEPITQSPEAARGSGRHRARPDVNAKRGGHCSSVTAGATWREERYRVDVDDSITAQLRIRRGEAIGFNVITDYALTGGSRYVMNTVTNGGNLHRLTGDKCVGMELAQVNDVWLQTRSEGAVQLMNRMLRGVAGRVRLRFRPFHDNQQAQPRGGGQKESMRHSRPQTAVLHTRMDPTLRTRAFAPVRRDEAQQAFANPHAGEGLRIQLQTRSRRRDVIPAKWSYVPPPGRARRGESTTSRSSESTSESFCESEVRRQGLIELRKEKVDLAQLLLRADTRRSRAAILEEMSRVDQESSSVLAKEAAELRLPQKRQRTRSPESESSESESS